MFEVNRIAILVAVVAAFIFSAIYYSVLSKQLQSARGKGAKTSAMTFNTVLIEIIRTFVTALFMAYALVNVRGPLEAAVMVFWLWLAFPVVLLTGSVIHEGTSIKLAVIHAFDWLVKLSIFGAIFVLWR